MEFELVDSRKVPRPRRKPTRRGQESQRIIESLTPGKTAIVRLGKDQNVRGVKVSLTHAARRLGKPVTLWDHDGVVYAELVEE